jgi:hypothetical protein
MWGLFGICSLVFIIECIVRYIKEKNKAFIIVPFFIILYYIAMSFIYWDVFYKNKWNSELAISFFSFSVADISEAINIFSVLYENNDINKTILIILAVLFCTMCISLIKRSKRTVLFLIFSTFFMVYVMLKVWGGGVFYQKFFLSILVIIFCYWIADSKNDVLSKISDWILTLFLLLLFFSPFFITTVKDDIQNTFTNTKEICKYINNKNIEKIIIITIEQDCILSDTFAVWTKNEIDHIVFSLEVAKKIILKKEDIITEDKYPKYIAVSSKVIVPEELPYKQVIPAPKNKVKIYDSKEYYSLYEKTE